MADADWKLPWEGGCRCGATRIRMTQPPFMAGACHCAGCQKMSASAYSLTLSFRSDGVEVTRGEPVLGGLKRSPRHYHCPDCLSWVFTRADDPDWLVNVRATMLDDHGWVRPFVELCRSEGFEWADTGAKHSYAQFPDPSDWGRLTQAFAAEGARPA
jgi:hypothetical protein